MKIIKFILSLLLILLIAMVLSIHDVELPRNYDNLTVPDQSYVPENCRGYISQDEQIEE